MKEFFKVTDLEDVFELIRQFPRMGAEEIPLTDAHGRVLADDLVSEFDLPDFSRSIVDGYAVQGSSTFGASDGNPAFLTVVGAIDMGKPPGFTIGSGQAAKIPTGAMLPEGADTVVMIEHTDAIDDTTIEAFRSVAPGQNIVGIGEDFQKGERILPCGFKIRPQEAGLLAALGIQTVRVYKRPLIGIISTGDEIVPLDQTPDLGQIRDTNTYTLSGLIKEFGGVPVPYGIVKDNFDALYETAARGIEECDMLLVSGGSSVGTRDFTIEVISAFSDADVLVHGISISPGKPTILAKVKDKPFWGLPGHVVSAMIVFSQVVRPFIEKACGLQPRTLKQLTIKARLNRNISSAQGRVDYIRVRLLHKDEDVWVEPILGKSALINTMVKADGLIEVGRNIEGLDQGTTVEVIPM